MVVGVCCGWVGHDINIGDSLVRRPRPCRPKGKVEVANVLRGCARIRVRAQDRRAPAAFSGKS